MAVFLHVWTVVISAFLLLSALPVHGRGDTFYIEHAQGSDWDEARDPPDDILDINQELIFPGAPESSFLIEGDIVKASPFRLFPSANPRWPKKRGIVQIPYVISYKYDESSVKILKGAFEDFSKFTCIKFVPYSNQRDFIAIAPLSGCFSSVGRIGGMQVVSLAPACLRKGKGVALHELMHVVGFWHEHSRADRDKYISISWDEILTGFEINFMKSWNTNMLVDYDYSSVMHYGRNAFSMSGSATITPLSSSLTFLGQRWNLSNSDVARVNKLYKCSQAAAQPEASTKGVIKENVMDFMPSEPKPHTTQNKPKVSTAWNLSSIASSKEMPHPVREPLGTITPSSKVAGENISTTEAQTREVWSPGPKIQMQRTMSQHTPGKAEGSKKSLVVTEEMLHQTVSGEMAVSDVAQKTSEPQTLQNPTSSARELRSQPPSYEEVYIPSDQSPVEVTTSSAPEVELSLSFLTKSPDAFPMKTVQGSATRLGKKALDWTPSRTRAMHIEHRTELPTTMVRGELSTAMEIGSSPLMRSSEAEDRHGSPSPAEDRPFSAMENQTGKQLAQLFLQTISIFRNETGSTASTTPVVQAEAGSSYTTASPRASRNLITASGVVGLEETKHSEVESLGSFGTIESQSEIMKKERESFHTKEGSRPTDVLSSSGKEQYTRHRLEPGMFATQGLPSLGSSEAQESHLSQATAGAPSPWASVIGPLAVSKLNVATYSKSNQTQVEQFDRSAAQLARKGYRKEALTTHIPPGPLLVQVTEPELEAEEQTLVHAELPSQTPTLQDWASLAMETNQAIHPTEGTFPLPLSHTPRPAETRHKTSWLQQPSNTKVYGPSAHVPGWGPFADLHEEEFEHTLETASITTMWPSTAQEFRVSHEKEVRTGHSEEAKAHWKAPLLSPEPFEDQMPTQPKYRVAGTPWQRSSTPSVTTGLPGVVQIRNPNGPGAAAPQRPCNGELAGSSPGTEYGLTSTRVLPKLETTSQEHSGSEKRDHSPTSKGDSLPVRRTSPPPKDHTSSAMVSQLMQTRTPKRTVASDEGSVTAGSFNLSTILLSSKPALKGPQSSSPLRRTEPVMKTESPPTQFLETAMETKPSSKLKETLAEGEMTEPANATEDMSLHVMNLATNPTWKATAGRNGAQSPSLDMEPTGLPQVAAEGTALLLTIGSLKSPKHINLRGQPTSSQLRKETMTSMAKILAVDMVSALSASSTSPLDTRGNKATLLTGAKEATRRSSKKSGETALEIYASTPAPESHKTATIGVSTLGSREEHAVATKITQFQPEHGTQRPEVGYEHMNLEEMSGNHTEKMKSKENEVPPIDNPNFSHRVGKRSLAEIMATPASLSVALPEEIDHEFIGHMDEPSPVENVADKMEAAKPLPFGMSRLSTLLQGLPSALKKAENNQVAPPRTVKAPQPLTTFCPFEKNLCGWEQSKEDDLDWVLEEGQEQLVRTGGGGSPPGMPCTTSGGGYLSLMPLAHNSSQKAVLVSPVVQGIRCLKFWYSRGDLLMSEINVYIMLRNSSEWHKMWSLRGNQGTGWHLAAVAISKTCELQVVLEGSRVANVTAIRHVPCATSEQNKPKYSPMLCGTPFIKISSRSEYNEKIQST
ncbi:astacin-like metalloendopeptidase [Podarcis lilfordi]|uniref:Metalloendopeptidase n=1 Tax=Podarcis lilfordi TaxID=74358 RepID=A0AA35PFE4_9SAUR|nr:astacin-like metalloendopeptidase [Podarcis lilfordi]